MSHIGKCQNVVVLCSQSIGPWYGIDCRTSCSPSIVPLTGKNHRTCSSLSILAMTSRRSIVMAVDHLDRKCMLSWMKGGWIFARSLVDGRCRSERSTVGFLPLATLMYIPSVEEMWTEG